MAIIIEIDDAEAKILEEEHGKISAAQHNEDVVSKEVKDAAFDEIVEFERQQKKEEEEKRTSQEAAFLIEDEEIESKPVPDKTKSHGLKFKEWFVTKYSEELDSSGNYISCASDSDSLLELRRPIFVDENGKEHKGMAVLCPPEMTNPVMIPKNEDSIDFVYSHDDGTQSTIPITQSKNSDGQRHTILDLSDDHKGLGMSFGGKNNGFIVSHAQDGTIKIDPKNPEGFSLKGTIDVIDINGCKHSFLCENGKFVEKSIELKEETKDLSLMPPNVSKADSPDLQPIRGEEKVTKALEAGMDHPLMIEDGPVGTKEETRLTNPIDSIEELREQKGGASLRLALCDKISTKDTTAPVAMNQNKIDQQEAGRA